MRAERLTGIGDARLMLIGPERLFYAGLLGRPGVRNLGGIAIYVASAGQIVVRAGGGPPPGARAAATANWSWPARKPTGRRWSAR